MSNSIENDLDTTLCETCEFQEYFPCQKPCVTCLVGSPLRVSGDRYIRKVITNADKIRAMTDEELANLLGQFDEGCSFPERGTCPPGRDFSCYPCWLDWMKQEAKDD